MNRKIIAAAAGAMTALAIGFGPGAGARGRSEPTMVMLTAARMKADGDRPEPASFDADGSGETKDGEVLAWLESLYDWAGVPDSYRAGMEDWHRAKMLVSGTVTVADATCEASVADFYAGRGTRSEGSGTGGSEGGSDSGGGGEASGDEPKAAEIGLTGARAGWDSDGSGGLSAEEAFGYLKALCAGDADALRQEASWEAFRRKTLEDFPLEERDVESMESAIGGLLASKERNAALAEESKLPEPTLGDVLGDASAGVSNGTYSEMISGMTEQIDEAGGLTAVGEKIIEILKPVIDQLRAWLGI
jgi:hypothetical protein